MAEHLTTEEEYLRATDYFHQKAKEMGIEPILGY